MKAPRNHALFGKNIMNINFINKMTLLRKLNSRQSSPDPRQIYALAATGTFTGQPTCVKRLSSATRTCNCVT